MGRKQTPQEWRHHFRAQKQGSQTRVEYCRIHDLTISSFDYWATRIRKENRETENPIVRIGLVDKSGLSLQSENHPLILHIGDRYRLAIGSPVNQDDVRKLLEVLENR
jgi:hypothetical protein